MIELIVGGKGKGKTKVLLAEAADAVKVANGNVVYVDKNKQHMYELSNKIRLIDITQYPVKGEEGFLGFISGIIASDHDLEYLILDSFLTIAGINEKDMTPTLEALIVLAENAGVKLLISVSKDQEEIPECFKELIKVAL